MLYDTVRFSNDTWQRRKFYTYKRKRHQSSRIKCDTQILWPRFPVSNFWHHSHIKSKRYFFCTFLNISRISLTIFNCFPKLYLYSKYNISALRIILYCHVRYVKVKCQSIFMRLNDTEFLRDIFCWCYTFRFTQVSK